MATESESGSRLDWLSAHKLSISLLNYHRPALMAAIWQLRHLLASTDPDTAIGERTKCSLAAK